MAVASVARAGVVALRDGPARETEERENQGVRERVAAREGVERLGSCSSGGGARERSEKERASWERERCLGEKKLRGTERENVHVSCFSTGERGRGGYV